MQEARQAVSYMFLQLQVVAKARRRHAWRPLRLQQCNNSGWTTRYYLDCCEAGGC